MPVQVACSKCNAALAIPDEHLGRPILCPYCNSTVSLTPPAPRGGTAGAVAGGATSTPAGAVAGAAAGKSVGKSTSGKAASLYPPGMGPSAAMSPAPTPIAPPGINSPLPPPAAGAAAVSAAPSGGLNLTPNRQAARWVGTDASPATSTAAPTAPAPTATAPTAIPPLAAAPAALPPAASAPPPTPPTPPLPSAPLKSMPLPQPLPPAKSAAAAATAAPPAPPPAVAVSPVVPQAARFIAADPTAGRVPLGLDGKLPMLVLVDGEQGPEKVEKPAQNAPPWLLILALGFSITASVALLFVDTSTGRIERQSKGEAREALQRFYVGDEGKQAAFQLQVRLIIQANQRGDRDEERQYCRELLNMLHSESNNKNTGLTGRRDDADPPMGLPNDRHLISLINVLLNN